MNPSEKYGELLYYRGKIFKIVWAERAKGSCLAKEFLDGIKPPDWGKLDRVLKRLADYGKVSNKEQFRSVGDGLFEVKGGAKRLVGYFAPDHFILTHGFIKRGGGKTANKFPPEQRERALEIQREFQPVFQQIMKELKNG